MLINEAVFELLIGLALVITCAAPVILIGLLIADWKRGELW